MVQYQFKNALAQVSARIQGDLRTKLVAEIDAQIGPAILNKSLTLHAERKNCADGDVEVLFVKSGVPFHWRISADRKRAVVLEGGQFNSTAVRTAAADAEWIDPLELFLRAREFATADLGKKVRRFHIPIYNRDAQMETIFLLSDPSVSKAEEYQIQTVGLRAGDKLIDLGRKGLSIQGNLPGGFPERIQLLGFDPFDFCIRGEFIRSTHQC